MKTEEVRDEYTKRVMSKEKAIEFTRKYLEDRLDSITNKTPLTAYQIAKEYMILDIIPYIYGEALD